MPTLREQIAEFKKGFVAQVPVDVQDLMEAKNQELEDSSILAGALKVGDKLPEVELPNALGEKVSLSSLLSEKPVVLTFYRGGWCPYCNLALKALQDNLAEIEELGAAMVAITPELPDSSMSTREKNELTFEVLSDQGNKVASQLGLVFTLPEELRPVYQEFGIDIPSANGDSSFGLPLAATYIIDRSGEVKYAFLDTDYRERAEPADVLEALKSLV